MSENDKRMIEDMLYIYIIYGTDDLDAKHYNREDARCEAQRILEHYNRFEHVLQSGTKAQLDYDVSYLRMVASDARIYSTEDNTEWL